MEKNQKNVVLAFILGLVLPGLGLFYVAPWLVAGIGTVAVLVIYKVLGWIPLLGSVVMALVALVSAGLCVLYARAYNRTGKRVEIEGVTA
jgi:hypothetical protein